MAQSSFPQILSQLETTLEEYFVKKAPPLPENIKEIIVKIAPYLVLLAVVFSIPNFFVPGGKMYMTHMAGNLWLSSALLLPVLVLQALAIPGLFNRKKIAWKYMFWAQLIIIVTSLIQLNIGGLIIGGIVGFYILFQVKSLYK